MFRFFQIKRFINFAILKRFIAILFLTIFIFSSTEAHQLLRIPYVFTHFAEHQRQNTHLSFVAFLDLHYMHGSPKDRDYDEDMKLPFKTADKCQAGQPTIFLLPVLFTKVIKPLEIRTEVNNIYNDCFFDSGYHSGVWQPPKFC